MRYLLLFITFCATNILSAQKEDENPYCHKAQSFANRDLFLEADRQDDGRIDLVHYDFDWTIDPSLKYIKGIVKIKFIGKEDDLKNIKLSLSNSLNIDYIKRDNTNLIYTREGDYGLIIELNTPMNKNETGDIEIKYEGVPPTSGIGSFVAKAHGNNVPSVYTLSEPYGAQDWWPCKNGLTDKLDSIDVHITTQKGNRAASNGKLISIVEVNDTLHQFNWKHRYPIVPYLVCLGVTNYEAYTDTLILSDGKELEMLNFVYPESLSSAISGTRDLVKVIQWYDSLFYPYPFRNEKYGHAEFGFRGGQEHQTMTFVSNYDIGLLSHELAHQWFGDMVTCGSWEDIWLNEGFATYSESIMREKFIPSTWTTWKSGKLNSVTSAPDGSVFVTDTTSINRIFSGRLTYNKGGYLLHMLKWVLGDEHFFQGIRNYLEDRKYNYAKTNQLKRHLEEVSGQNLDEFFEDWFTGQGYPSYAIEWGPSDVFNYIEIKVNQKTSNAAVDFFEMPLPILCKGDGVDTLIRLDHTTNGQTFVVNLPFECKSVEFDPTLWLISKDNSVKEISTATQEPGLIKPKIYPTNTSNYLYIKDGTSGMDYAIYQLDGKIVYKGKINAGLEQVNFQHFATGIYTIVIKAGNRVVANSIFNKIE